MFHEEHQSSPPASQANVEAAASQSNPDAVFRAASTVLGADLASGQKDLLRTYAQWLIDEAIPAGGLGPREGDRVWGRHIGDSIGFAAGYDNTPGEVLDVGTGVGLPGIPLAILWPDTFVTLLDRGGRRIRLLYRVVRRLGLTNVRVAQGDVFAVADEWESVVFRGSVTAMEAVGLSARLLALPGTAVLGLSRRRALPESTRDLVSMASALGLEAHTEDVGSKLFDAPSWLLIMRTNGELPTNG